MRNRKIAVGTKHPPKRVNAVNQVPMMEGRGCGQTMSYHLGQRKGEIHRFNVWNTWTWTRTKHWDTKRECGCTWSSGPPSSTLPPSLVDHDGMGLVRMCTWPRDSSPRQGKNSRINAMECVSMDECIHLSGDRKIYAPSVKGARQ